MCIWSYMQIWKVVTIIIGVILISVGVFGLVQPAQHTEKEIYAGYSQSIHINVVDYLKHNILYGNISSIMNPSTIYDNITTVITISITISVNSVNNIGAVNYYVISQLSSATPLWNQTVYTTYHTLSNVSSILYTFTIPINITANITKANMIDEQIAQPQNSAVSLTINAYAQSKLGTANANVSFLAMNNYYVVHISGSHSNNGIYYKYVVIGNKPILNFNTDVYYALIGAGIMILIAGIVVAMPKPDTLQKFKKGNAEHIIQVSFMPSDNALKVSAPEDILKLASYAERPVFMNKNTIFTEIDGKYYYVVIKNENN